MLLAIILQGLWLALLFAAGGDTPTGMSSAAMPALLTIAVVIIALRVQPPQGSDATMPRDRSVNGAKHIAGTRVRYGAMALVFSVAAISTWLYLASLDRVLNVGHLLAIGFGLIATAGALASAFLTGRVS